MSLLPNGYLGYYGYFGSKKCCDIRSTGPTGPTGEHGLLDLLDYLDLLVQPGVLDRQHHIALLDMVYMVEKIKQLIEIQHLQYHLPGFFAVRQFILLICLFLLNYNLD